MNVLSDLIGTRITVSLWSHSGDAAKGDMMPVVTGIVRGISSPEIGAFCLLVQAEAFHRRGDPRGVGALSVFTLGMKGGCEVIPFQDSTAMQQYREHRDRLVLARTSGGGAEEIRAITQQMEHIWDSELSGFERDLVSFPGVP